MSEKEIQEAERTVRRVLGKFDWGDYGLDDLDPNVNPSLADDWKRDLAAEVVSALDAKNQLRHA